MLLFCQHFLKKLNNKRQNLHNRNDLGFPENVKKVRVELGQFLIIDVLTIGLLGTRCDRSS